MGVGSLGESEEAGWVLGGAVGVSISKSMSSSSRVRGAKQLVVFPLLRRHCCIAGASRFFGFVGIDCFPGFVIAISAWRSWWVVGGL